MKHKPVNTLTSNSDIFNVLKTGAHINFPECSFSCLLIGIDDFWEDSYCIRVDHYDKGKQCFDKFSLDRSGLEQALIFITKLGNK